MLCIFRTLNVILESIRLPQSTYISLNLHYYRPCWIRNYFQHIDPRAYSIQSYFLVDLLEHKFITYLFFNTANDCSFKNMTSKAHQMFNFNNANQINQSCALPDTWLFWQPFVKNSSISYGFYQYSKAYNTIVIFSAIFSINHLNFCKFVECTSWVLFQGERSHLTCAYSWFMLFYRFYN